MSVTLWKSSPTAKLMTFDKIVFRYHTLSRSFNDKEVSGTLDSNAAAQSHVGRGVLVVGMNSAAKLCSGSDEAQSLGNHD
jgi:hypothetical protein